MKTVRLPINVFPGSAPWTKRPDTPNGLANLVSITNTFIRGDRMRMSLRSALRTKQEVAVIDSHSPVFYQQWLENTSCTLAAKEFCQLASEPDKSVIRLQIDVAHSLSVSLADWTTLIRYCIACWQLTDSPALVLNSPQRTNAVDLFILRDTPFSWEVVKPEQQKIIHQMMGLQLALWLHEPDYRKMPLSESRLADWSNPHQYATFVSCAIDQLLTERKPETIHQLAEQLRTYYQIEADYQAWDHSFSKLRFRYARLPWLSSLKLSLGVDDIRIWLNFHRVFKHSPTSQHLLQPISRDYCTVAEI